MAEIRSERWNRRGWFEDTNLQLLQQFEGSELMMVEGMNNASVEQNKMEPVSIAMTRLFRAPRERVFAGFTRPELLARWWGTAAQADVDLRPGGTFRFTMTLPGDVLLVAYGEYAEVAPPERLVFTWRWEGSDEPATRVTLAFSEHDGVTTLSLTQTGFPSAEEAAGHQQGWNDCIDRLEELLQ